MFYKLMSATCMSHRMPCALAYSTKPAFAASEKG